MEMELPECNTVKPPLSTSNRTECLHPSQLISSHVLPPALLLMASLSFTTAHLPTVLTVFLIQQPSRPTPTFFSPSSSTLLTLSQSISTWEDSLDPRSRKWRLVKGNTGDKEENHTGKYVAQTHMYAQTKLDAASPWDELNEWMLLYSLWTHWF